MYEEIKKNLKEDEEDIEVAEEQVEEPTEEESDDSSDMELLKERLQEKANNGDALVQDVIEDQLDEIGNYDTPQEFLEHLTELYISGGGVGSMIYYDDTFKFLEGHSEEINKRLQEKMQDYGSSSLKEFFGDNYDDSDPLNIDNTNRNLFAWWAYEDVCRDVAYELNEEFNYDANI